MMSSWKEAKVNSPSMLIWFASKLCRTHTTILGLFEYEVGCSEDYICVRIRIYVSTGMNGLPYHVPLPYFHTYIVSNHISVGWFFKNWCRVLPTPEINTESHPETISAPGHQEMVMTSYIMWNHVRPKSLSARSIFLLLHGSIHPSRKQVPKTVANQVSFSCLSPLSAIGFEHP